LKKEIVENRLNDIDELIGKYLSWEASEEEIRIIDTWRREQEENEKYFQQLKTIFDRASAVTETIEVDADAAWNKLRARLRSDEGAKVVPLHGKQSGLNFILKIAASILLVAVAGFFVYKSFAPEKQVEFVAQQKVITDTLPDGSEVALNKKSQLSYAYNKKKHQHTVKLKGEAHFSINHEDDKKFIIEIDGIFIRDIGTSFNVKAYPESNTIEVVVDEGTVVFYNEKDSGVTLNANAKGIYDKVTKKFSLAVPETNVTSYKTRVFLFNGTSLKDVVEQLNNVYDKKIIIKGPIGDCPITVDFENESIDEIASVISITHRLTKTVTAAGIVLEGTSCEQ
jgi:ferric-dicitrate binding protein FerR (iron transport regulator)